MFDEGLLQRMELSILRQPFDGDYLFPLDAGYRIHTRPDRLLVNQNGTGPAQAPPAAMLRSRQADIGAQDPYKPALTVQRQLYGFIVECKADGLFHIYVPGLISM